MRKTNVPELNELLRRFELKRSGNKKKKAEYLLQYVDWQKLQPVLPEEPEAKTKGKAKRARGKGKAKRARGGNHTIDAMVESTAVASSSDRPGRTPPAPSSTKSSTSASSESDSNASEKEVKPLRNFRYFLIPPQTRQNSRPWPKNRL